MTTPDHDHDQDVSLLREATLRLSDQVATLSLALQTVNHLQARQLDTDRKVDVNRGEAQTAVRDLAKDTVTQRALTQRRLRIFAIGTAIVSFAISVAAMVVLYVVVQHQTDDQHQQRLALCHQRNDDAVSTARKTRDYFGPKLHAEQQNPNADPVLLSILGALAATQPQTVVCA